MFFELGQSGSLLFVFLCEMVIFSFSVVDDALCNLNVCIFVFNSFTAYQKIVIFQF